MPNGKMKLSSKPEARATYIMKGGVRYVAPYVHEFATFAKGRWLGRELLEVLHSEFGAHPIEYWKQAIESGFVSIHGKKVSPSYQFANGDKLKHITHRHEPCVVGKIDFVGEDNRIIAVNKPSSMPVHPSGAYRFNSLLQILGHEPAVPTQPEKLYLVHRLDRVTSGLVLLAKSSESAKSITEEIMSGKTEKIYLARVKGKFPAKLEKFKNRFEGKKLLEIQYKAAMEDRTAAKEEGKTKKRKMADVHKEDKEESDFSCASAPVFEEVRKNPKVGYGYAEDEHPGMLLLRCPLQVLNHKDGVHACNPAGKESLSGFKHMGYDEKSDTSLVLCRPFTGRTHQLRLHLQILGNPIANDPCYGGELFYDDAPSLKKASQALVRMKKLGIQPLSKVPHFEPVEVEDGESGEMPSAGADLEAEVKVEGAATLAEDSMTYVGEGPGKGGEMTQEEYLVRKCRYCVASKEKDAQELEAALHCKGIWLHALEYSGNQESGSWRFATSWPDWAAAFESKAVEDEKKR